MRENLLRKGLVLGIILLFVGVCFVPSINANFHTKSKNADMVEINIELFGINELIEHKVLLSKGDVLKVHNLIDGIEDKLEKSETIDENVELLNGFIMELDKYGVFPEGKSVNEIQGLVTERYQNSMFMKQLEGVCVKNKISSDIDENSLCSVSGNLHMPISINFISASCLATYGVWFLIVVLYEMFRDNFEGNYPIITDILFGLIDSLLLAIDVIFFPFLAVGLVALLIAQINPLQFFNVIYFENSSGYIETNGLNGEKIWEGNLTGSIIGFTGIKIWDISERESFFSGFALSVDIESV